MKKFISFSHYNNFSSNSSQCQLKVANYNKQQMKYKHHIYLNYPKYPN